jgi:hypothetical protein
MSLIIMNSKSTENIQQAYETLINAYKANLKVVRMISSDHEATLKSCESFLGSKGVKIALRIPYEHEKIAERSVRMIREKMEVKRRELPYDLPPELFDALAVEVTRCCNMVPNAKTIPHTPSEMVTDTKFNYLTDVQIPFGMPVLVDANGAKYTGSVPAQEIGICLGSASNTKGGIWVYIPGRQQALVRRGLKPMPMTRDIIDFMNDWARRKPAKRKKDGEEEPMIIFSEEPIYSEDLPSDVKDIADLIKQKSRIDDFSLKDKILNEDLEKMHPKYNPGTDPSVEIPEDLMLPPQSELKRKLDDMSKDLPVTGTKNARRESFGPSPNYGSTPYASSSPNKRRQSIDNIQLPSTDLGSKLEEAAASSEYSNHLDTNPNLRRSSRTTKGVAPGKMNLSINKVLHMAQYLRNWMDSEICRLHYVLSTNGHMSLGKSLKSDYAAEAEAAACAELLQLVKLKCWRYLRSRSDANVSVHTNETPCSMFLRPKHNTQGTFLLWKARLVGGGHRTDPSAYDDFEKHSPTVPIDVAMLQLGIAAKERGNIEVFDIPCAYLNASLDKDKQQLMRFPKNIADLLCKVDPEARRFRQQDGTILVQVQRALYGYPESAKLWYEYLKSALVNGGYTVSPSEPCLFKRLISPRSPEQRREWSIVSIYVDDCLHTYNSERLRRELYAKLRDANISQPKVQQLNLANEVSYLGINLSMRGPGKIFMSQPGYVKEILKEYQPRRSYPTPCTEDIFKRPPEELDGDPVDVTEYLSKLMKLMFLATRTRPDLQLTLSVLSTKARNPNVHDMERLDRVVGYLLETKDKGLWINISNLKLHAYFDASWACHSDLKGHSGILITLGKNGLPLIWKSKKQKVVSRSSTEAELIAMFEGLDSLLYMRRLSEFLGCENPDPIVIYQDNTSAMKLSYLGGTTSGSNSKFMDLKYFWIKEYLELKIFTLEYLPSASHLGDFFASPRIGSHFRLMRDTIMGSGS